MWLLQLLTTSLWPVQLALATSGNTISLMMFKEFLQGTSTQYVLLTKPSPPWDEQSSSLWLMGTCRGRRSPVCWYPFALPAPHTMPKCAKWEIWEVPERRWGYCNSVVRYNLKKKISQRELLILALINGFFLFSHIKPILLHFSLSFPAPCEIHSQQLFLIPFCQTCDILNN